jgi:polyisoprenoid-binding protein YceI
MTGPDVLDAERHSQVTLRSVSLTGPPWGPEVAVRLTLHGVARDIVLPLAMHRRGEELVITGTFALRTSDFGMTPFSVLGGGLQVLDEVKIRFRILARRTMHG